MLSVCPLPFPRFTLPFPSQMPPRSPVSSPSQSPSQEFLAARENLLTGIVVLRIRPRCAPKGGHKFEGLASPSASSISAADRLVGEERGRSGGAVRRREGGGASFLRL